MKPIMRRWLGRPISCGFQPGTLARMLVHAGRAEGLPARSDTRAAIARLVRRSGQRPAADAVALVNEARAALGAHG